MKKKVLTVLAVLTMACIAGCQSGTEPEENVPTQEETEVVTKAPETTENNTPVSEPTTKPKTETTPQPTENPTSKPTVKPTATPMPEPISPGVKMSEDIFDFTFELGGMVYQFPMTYKTLVDSGWKLHENEDENEQLAGYEKYCFKRFVKDGVEQYFNVINMSGNAMPMKECLIGGMSVNTYLKTSFSLPKEITVGATKDAIINAFGAPQKEAGSYIEYKKENFQNITFYLESDMTCSSIEVNCYKAIGETTTAVSQERPAYFDEYVVPSKLGDDIRETVLELDGVIYQLPCPLEQFLNSGWEIASQDITSLASGKSRNQAAKIRKGDMTLYVGLTNYSSKEVYLENCAVYQLYFDIKQFRNAAEGMLKLPAGITGKTTPEEAKILESVLTVSESGTGEYSCVFYSYSDSNKRISLNFYLNGVDGYFTLENKKWDY